MLGGCTNPLQEPVDTGEAGYQSRASKGLVRIRLGEAEEGNARTILPATDPVLYVLTLTSKDKVIVEDQSGSAGTFSRELDPGSWHIKVEGFLPSGEEGDDIPVANGEADFEVEAGAALDVRVVLNPTIEEEGIGNLTYDITYPEELSAAILRIFPIPVTENNPIRTIDLLFTGPKDETGIALAAGYYRVAVYLNRDKEGTGQAAVDTDVVHIYGGLSTTATFSFGEEGFLDVSKTFTSIAALSAYLATAEPNTVDTPYVVALTVDLETDQGVKVGNDPLRGLFDGLHGKYVTLDMKGCTNGNTGFSSWLTGRPDLDKIVSLVLPADLTEIGRNAFYQFSSLGSVDLSTTELTEIPPYLFADCSSLNSVNLPTTLTSIGDTAFGSMYPNRGAALSSIDLSKTQVTSIGENAFANCASLKELKLPATEEVKISSIGQGAFNGCKALTEIDLSGTEVTELGNTVFQNCTSLTSITLPPGLTSLGNSVFAGNEALKTIALPSTLTTIGSSVFQNCTALEAVDLSHITQTELTGVFYGCSSLTSVSLPETLNQLSLGGPSSDLGVFGNCTSLTAITLDKNTNIAGGTFTNCPNLIITLTGETGLLTVSSDGKTLMKKDGSTISLLAYPTDGTIEIPDQITDLPANIFYGAKITSIKIPASVKTIGTVAFEDSSITSIDFSDATGLESIGPRAFAQTSLTAIDLSKATSLAEIGNNAFYQCMSLKSVTLPGTLPYTGIGNTVFGASPYIAEFNVTQIPDKTNYLSSPDGKMVISNNTTLILYPPDAAGKVTVPSGITTIARYAFSGCKAITEIAFTSINDLTSIEVNAFQSCAFTSMDLSGATSLITISNYAFADNPSLTSMKLPPSLQTLGTYVFRGCTALTSIDLPVTLTSIGNNTFNGCSSLALCIVRRWIPTESSAAQITTLGGTNVFANTPGNLVILVPPDALTTYRGYTRWQTHSSKIISLQ
jgi:hypothetical protein